MSRFFRRVGRDIKEGFWGVIRHGGMAISSASAVTITLCIVSVVLLFSFNVDSMTKEIEDTVRIKVLIAHEYESSVEELRIKNAIEAIESVSSVTLSTKQQEFETMTSDPKYSSLFESYREDNPLHDSFYVEVSDGDSLTIVSNKIEAIEGVYNVEHGGEAAVLLINAMNSIRVGGIVIVAALGALAIFLISNTIKLTISARKTEISIMRSVGATNNYIRFPFVIEGMIIGFLGSLLPIAFTVFGYIYLFKSLNGVLFSNLFVMIEPHPFVIYISLALLALGMFVGLVGSFLSVTRYLRWKR